MIIDTKQIISMTEANQNFSKASKTADLYGQAVIVKNNKIIGEGYHTRYGCLHAEREAIKRMEVLNIYSETISQFVEEDLLSYSVAPLGTNFWLNKEQREIVKKFEEEYNALVYFIVRTETEFGTLDSFLYVSDHEDEWEMDNEDIAEGYAMVYCINLDCPDFSEFGSIAYESINGGIKRIG